MAQIGVEARASSRGATEGAGAGRRDLPEPSSTWVGTYRALRWCRSRATTAAARALPRAYESSRRPVEEDWSVSFDIFLQRFRHGEPAAADSSAVLDTLKPYAAHDDKMLVTADGDAAIYGLDDPGAGHLMINHAGGRVIWDVIYELALAAGFVIMPVGCGTLVPGAKLIPHLPPELP